MLKQEKLYVRAKLLIMRVLTVVVDYSRMAGLDFLEGYPSGQRGQTVNLLAQPSEVRILPPPPEQFCFDDLYWYIFGMLS